MLLPFLDSWSPLLKVTKFTAYLSAIYIGYSIASLEVFNRQLFLLYILEYSLIISTAVVLIVLFMSFGLKFFKALKHFIKRR